MDKLIEERAHPKLKTHHFNFEIFQCLIGQCQESYLIEVLRTGIWLRREILSKKQNLDFCVTNLTNRQTGS